jgi:hypothetical protein
MCSSSGVEIFEEETAVFFIAYDVLVVHICNPEQQVPLTI